MIQPIAAAAARAGLTQALGLMPQIVVDSRYPIIERLIAAHYGPGALSAVDDHSHIWQAMENSLDLPQLRKLLLEINSLLHREDAEIMDVYTRNSAYDFQSASDARTFFE